MRLGGLRLLLQDRLPRSATSRSCGVCSGVGGSGVGSACEPGVTFSAAALGCLVSAMPGILGRFAVNPLGKLTVKLTVAMERQVAVRIARAAALAPGRRTPPRRTLRRPVSEQGALLHAVSVLLP